MTREETRRAHLVIFLCDGDLTASQMAQLQYLEQLDKPLLLALNKVDRYSREELDILLDRLRAKTGLDKTNIVTLSAGGREQVVRLLGEEMEQGGEA